MKLINLSHPVRITPRISQKQTAELINMLLALLFLYAAANKLIDQEKFKVQLGQSPLLTPYTNLIVLAIPALEIVISVMLLLPKTILAGLYASFTMMVMFTTYILAILSLAGHIPCSCGGILEKMSWTQHLIFNICFILIALTGVLLHKPSRLIRHLEGGLAARHFEGSAATRNHLVMSPP